MAKTNPLYKPKAGKTAEQVAIEEFMNTIPPECVIEGDQVIDNTITEVIDTPDVSLDPIVDSVDVAEQLDELAEDADGITTAPALESYKRIFTQMSTLGGWPHSHSMEDFKPTKGGVRKFSRAIREHADHIRSTAVGSLEGYADRVDESVGTMMSNYKQALGKLNAIKSNLHNEKDKIVLVNQKEAWKLFHMRNELMDMSEFDMEIKGIKELEALIAEGMGKVRKMAENGADGKALSKFLNILLMNNTTVKVKDGRAYFEEIDVDAPMKEWTSTDWPIHLAYALVNKEYRGGKGDELTVIPESTKTFGEVIEKVKGLGPVMAKLDKDVDELTKFIKGLPDDKRSNIEKAASPVLELAANTIKHVTEVTYGIMKMFSRMGKEK